MPGHAANSFHEKAGRSQDGSVFRSVDPNFLTEPPLSPSFHPQSLMSDFRSLPVGRPRYYAGDSDFGTSTSPVLKQTVNE
jgi:hypothetical protein